MHHMNWRPHERRVAPRSCGRDSYPFAFLEISPTVPNN